MHTRTGCICLAFPRCAFSNVSSNSLCVSMQSHLSFVNLRNNHCNALCFSFVHFKIPGFRKFLPHKSHAFSDISCESSDYSQVRKMFKKSAISKHLCITRFQVFHNYLPHKSHAFSYIYIMWIFRLLSRDKNIPQIHHVKKRINIIKVQIEWLEMRIR